MTLSTLHDNSRSSWYAICHFQDDDRCTRYPLGYECDVLIEGIKQYGSDINVEINGPSFHNNLAVLVISVYINSDNAMALLFDKTHQISKPPNQRLENQFLWRH
jgi:hypothetical protein